MVRIVCRGAPVACGSGFRNPYSKMNISYPDSVNDFLSSVSFVIDRQIKNRMKTNSIYVIVQVKIGRKIVETVLNIDWNPSANIKFKFNSSKTYC